jgi:hypothetical protein
MSRKLQIRKRRLVRCRNRLDRLKKRSAERKQKLKDRCNKLSAKCIEIITKIIDKIEATATLRQRLPQRELEQIIQQALSARYPDTYYRPRNDTQPYRLGTSRLYNLSVMDVSSARNSQSRWVYDWGMDSIFSSRSVTLAVVTQTAQSDADPRGNWRAANASALRVMNPDLLTSTDSSSDSSSESLSAHSGSVGPTPTLLADSSSENENDGSECSTIDSDETIDEQPTMSISSPDCGTHEGSDEEFGYSDADSMYGPSALSMSASSESSSKRTGAERSSKSFRTGVNWVSGPLSDCVVPHLPALYFIDRPDPSLCCLVTSALRELDPSILENGGLWSCSNTSRAHLVAECGIAFAEDKPHSSTDDTVYRARRNRNAFLYRKAIGTEHLLPLPLKINKEKNESQLTQESISTSVSASSAASAASSISASTSPNPSPTRQNSLCVSCRDIRGRRRALAIHPFHPIQDTHKSDQHPVPEERTRPFNPNNLPSPLRAGPRCTHCRNTWSGMISTPDLLTPQLSTRSEGEDLEEIPTPFTTSTKVSLNVVELVDVAFNTGGLSFGEIFPDLITCLNSGAVARNRRIFDH